jgi:hypothetical protein
VCETVGTEVVVDVPSPKVQAYEVMVLTGAAEADASNEVGEPGIAGVAVNAATGAWSGETLIAWDSHLRRSLPERCRWPC